MPRNIVILFDGTSNQISHNRSNILRLYGTLAKTEGQVVYYDPGVGTFGSNSAASWLKSKAAEFWGLATGWGMDANVKEAYRFLVRKYRKAEEPDANGETRDRIHIFGFSRGAYTARVLAGFINAFGLMEERNLNLLDYAYRAYKRIGENADRDDEAFGEMRLFERILRPDRPPMRMLGLFDTVSSVLESSRYGWRFSQHAYTATNPSVESVFHALAIDERRTMFPPQLWNEEQPYRRGPFANLPAVPQQVEQVWFPGYHADIGGGHPEADSALCKVPLFWMIGKAKTCGLEFTTSSINALVLGRPEGGKYTAPDPLAPGANSMRMPWHVLEVLPRRKHRWSNRPSLFGLTIPFFERRRIPEGAKLHRSVQERADCFGQLPPNAPEAYTLVD